MVPEEQERHEMVLERSHESGADEFYCPICGRRILMQWPPNYKKTVLEPGDINVIHSGGKGGIHMQQAETRDEHEISIDDPSLAPWSQWMDEVDFGDRL